MTEENDFQHWQLPDVTEEAGDDITLFERQPYSQTEVEEQESVVPLTMAELEAMQTQAEEEAREAGREAGYQEGLEKGRLDGLEQGHEEGFNQGKQQGVEEGLIEAKSLLERLEQLVKHIENPIATVDSQVEMSLLNLTTNLAKAVIGSEVKTHPEHILSVMRQGIDALPIKKQEVTIRLNPADAELVETAYSVAQLDKHKWEIESDPTLEQGDCILGSLKSEVDMRLSVRTQTVLNSLTEQQTQLQKQLQQSLADEIAKAEKANSVSDTAEPSDEQSKPTE
ncbi:flagellar assembly protein FliH [Shewanella sp. 202IG2-18]|uniref:flagellar assembly protein FliH n=1 Tax=Parashewanella hymeniacidonis TaxID=2807618 RepID=UPI001960DC87|nr:flagellar assembly protein FliH [Parashewanella hymeniacidonis]MBM7072222.1 flagellar assembly protein FliH [Parashewanella hymeniacidonis]